MPYWHGTKNGFVVTWLTNTNFQRGCGGNAASSAARAPPAAPASKEVGRTDTLPLGECGKGDAFALGEYRIEPARPEKQLYQSRIRVRGCKRIGTLHHDSLAEVVAALGTGVSVIFPSLMIGIDQSIVAERRNAFGELIDGVLLCGSEHFEKSLIRR